MVASVPQRTALLGVIVATAAIVVFPGISFGLVGGEPEPPELSVESFERLATGCAEDVATYAQSRSGSGSYTRVSFIETSTESTEIAARTERTSPPGADLSTFRVYLKSAGEPRDDATCTMGVQYRIELSHEPGSSSGLGSSDDGTRVLWLENGEYSGCSSRTSGSIDSECHRFTTSAQSDQAWTNASVSASASA